VYTDHVLCSHWQTTGPIPLSAYMRQCLTSPEGGYYTRQNLPDRDQFGAKGDFITSPEISQVFGELIGIWVVAEWMAQGRKSSGVQIIELGPGRGTLMNDMLRTISQFRPLAAAIDTVYLVEAGPHLREKQKELLCGSDAKLERFGMGWRAKTKYGSGQNIVWVEDLKFIPKDDATSPFIIAHEFFDALPIHAFQSVESKSRGLTVSSSQGAPPRRQNEWRELLVAPTSPYPDLTSTTSSSTPTSSGPDKPEFTLTVSKEPTPFSQYLPKTSPRYQSILSTTGSTIEISPESLTLAADIATRIGGSSNTSTLSPTQSPSPSLKQPSGAALILDYGPSSTIPTNSLRGIRSHAIVSPFSSPGLVDISVDVDFSALAEAALNASPGVAVHSPIEQALFLHAMGIKERSEALIQEAERRGGVEAAKRIEGAWKRLVDRSPQGMGRLYKVMAVLPHVPGKVRRPVGFGGDVKL
jgi:NADH dehydrogenase [ubiquinone] 1 alpha subcomplex assembly factor 7